MLFLSGVFTEAISRWTEFAFLVYSTVAFSQSSRKFMSLYHFTPNQVTFLWNRNLTAAQQCALLKRKESLNKHKIMHDCIWSIE